MVSTFVQGLLLTSLLITGRVVKARRSDCIAEFNPDSAVGIDRKREAQPFRSEVDGFCLEADIAQRCFEGRFSLIATTCESAK